MDGTVIAVSKSADYTFSKPNQGNIIRKAGIMSIVLVGGEVFPDDPIRIEYPPGPHVGLDVV
ncbi:MAG: hypothetical protein AMXMBFR60_07530 [Chloroflexota bacterium]|nr:hypothetical protein [Anaerolineales bacterium]